MRHIRPSNVVKRAIMTALLVAACSTAPPVVTSDDPLQAVSDAQLTWCARHEDTVQSVARSLGLVLSQDAIQDFVGIAMGVAPQVIGHDPFARLRTNFDAVQACLVAYEAER